MKHPLNVIIDTWGKRGAKVRSENWLALKNYVCHTDIIRPIIDRLSDQEKTKLDISCFKKEMTQSCKDAESKFGKDAIIRFKPETGKKDWVRLINNKDAITHFIRIDAEVRIKMALLT